MTGPQPAERKLCDHRRAEYLTGESITDTHERWIGFRHGFHCHVQGGASHGVHGWRP